jgi:Domain of unknown function (DUF222)/HNH endonuclease
MLETRDIASDPAAADPFESPFDPATEMAERFHVYPDRMAGVPGRTTESIPPRLAQMAPGPILAAFMASVDVTRLSGHDIVSVMQAHQRLASHFHAAVSADMMALVEALAQDDTFEEACFGAEAEIRVALNLTRRAAQTELALAVELHRRIPRVLEALSAGDIDERRAQVFDRNTADLSPAIARSIVDRVIDDAPGLTTGELAARLRELRIEADPEAATTRLERAVEDRRVVLEPTPDGTANLHAYDLPPQRAASIMDLLDHTARSLPADDRSIDHKRADVLMDLLDGPRDDALPTRRGVIDLVVDLDTLAELNDHAGDLAGFGPIVADIARQVATERIDQTWRYTVTNGDGTVVIDTGTTRRRPTAAQRREVQARDRTCVFPGCRMPALRSDVDHRIPWVESGRTAVEDLAPLCRHCHTIRHRAAWTYRRLQDGRHCWTTRVGHTYITSGRSP